jgi:hypothetical protein
MKNLDEIIISLNSEELEQLKQKVEELENQLKEVSNRN